VLGRGALAVVLLLVRRPWLKRGQFRFLKRRARCFYIFFCRLATNPVSRVVVWTICRLLGFFAHETSGLSLAFLRRRPFFSLQSLLLPERFSFRFSSLKPVVFCVHPLLSFTWCLNLPPFDVTSLLCGGRLRFFLSPSLVVAVSRTWLRPFPTPSYSHFFLPYSRRLRSV